MIVNDGIFSTRVRTRVLEAVPIISYNVQMIRETMGIEKSDARSRSQVPIEVRLVRDADRLDAIGAVGITRCFIYNGASKMTLRMHLTAGIEHIRDKLLNLKECIVGAGPSARASILHARMEEFLGELEIGDTSSQGFLKSHNLTGVTVDWSDWLPAKFARSHYVAHPFIYSLVLAVVSVTRLNNSAYECEHAWRVASRALTIAQYEDSNLGEDQIRLIICLALASCAIRQDTMTQTTERIDITHHIGDVATRTAVREALVYTVIPHPTAERRIANKMTFEAVVVRDALIMNSIGAIGLARIFAHTGQFSIDYIQKNLCGLCEHVISRIFRGRSQLADFYMRKFLDQLQGELKLTPLFLY
jgi:hypothetical protein